MFVIVFYKQALNGHSNGNGNGTTGSGIVGGIRTAVKNCAAADNQKNGIVVGNDSIVLENHANHNGLGATGDGISFGATSLAQGNDASGNTGDGIHGTGNLNRIDGNLADSNTGIGIHGGADFIFRNCSNNNTGGNYIPATGTNIGPVGNASTATSPFANFQ
jgi:hypothetical protein